MILAAGVVGTGTVLTVVLAVTYLRRWRLPRPPVGVFNDSDVVAMIVGVVTAPVLYLLLPTPVAGAVFGLTLLSVLLFTLRPAPWPRWCRCLVAVSAVAATAAAGLALGRDSRLFALGNDVLIMVCVVGIGNLWVQTGMRVRQLAGLAAALTAYDLIATAWTPLTASFLTQLGRTPILPMIFWPETGRQLGLGLGDLLLLVALTLVARRSYGVRAALATGAAGLASTAAVILPVAVGRVDRTVPTLIVLGPVTLVACWWLHRRPERDRTGPGVRPAVGAGDPTATRPEPRTEPSVSLSIGRR